VLIGLLRCGGADWTLLMKIKDFWHILLSGSFSAGFQQTLLSLFYSFQGAMPY